MFGVVFVAAIDGCSGFVTAVAAMPVKNNVAIYRDIFGKKMITLV